ncbi:metallophosphoesterase [Wenyingzhuangia sp. IMCC45533]
MKLLYFKYTLNLSILLTLIGCATYEKQISEQFKNWSSVKDEGTEISNIYLIGDAGGSPNSNQTFQSLKQKLASEGENSSVIFLGDNVYPAGLSPKKGRRQTDGLNKLTAQTDILKNYKGQKFFIPGNHDWMKGLKGLKEQEKFIEKTIGKNTFLPENGCPLKVVHLNSKVDVIFIDSQWYITDWDKHPEINDKCDEIKTREKFFIELEGLINKSQSKITLIAMHHPTVSRGTHGGAISLKSHLYPIGNKVPLPGLGTVIQTIRKTSGLNTQDIQGYNYNELVKRVTTLAKEHERIMFVSGHDHNLQYLFNQGIPQIVSGSGSKQSPTFLNDAKGFSYGQNGYVKLSIYDDEQVVATFISNDETVFKTVVFRKEVEKKDKNYDISNIGSTKKATIYSKDRTDKSKAYKALWGEHYRNAYSTPIEAKTVSLDTLYGGLKLVKKGGGHQSKSLRFVNPEGKQYVMRALKKSAVRFLQTVAFKKDYIADKMKNTLTEDLLYDFYTSAHPYTPFIVGDLSDPLGIYHTNPKLFYVPKQNAISPHNDEFGDALYMIEERPEDGHVDLNSFGSPDDIISTDDLLKELRENKQNKLDEESYVTARLFDMIIGDWDRHVDQWRWAVFKNGKQKTFRPIPRDRDQAFSSYDGAVLTTLTSLVDPIKLMQTYDKKMRNIFKFNDEPYPIDISLLQESEYSLWDKQALFIKENLTDEIIDNAFDKLPKSVQNNKTEKIKQSLKYRRDHAPDIASQYREIMEKFAIVKGTDKDNLFEISSDEKITTVNVYNLKDGKKDKLHFTKKFNNKNTKEIWVYGLDDDDIYKVENVSKKSPKIRLIGGQDEDEYNVKDSKNISVHDFKSKKNKFDGKFRKHLTNQYSKNVYHFRKIKDHSKTMLPLVSYNPDDEISIGASISISNYGYNQQPFTNKHSINIKYFSVTNGFDIKHASEFATYINKWNFFINTRFTSSNFSNNFFGFGNNTKNTDDSRGFDYNRVKTEIKKIEPGFVWSNARGAIFNVSIPYKIYEIEETEGRFLNDQFNDFFGSQQFIGLNTNLNYENYDSNTLPSLGFQFYLNSGWDYNITSESSLFFIKASTGFIQPISSSKRWVVASKFRSQFNFADEFQLYQSAFVGGDNGLRGFRNERFAGKTAYSQNTDLRYTIKKTRTPILPVTYGVSAGFDYGRVWSPNETSNKWHTAYGGSFWLSIPGVTKANLNLFNSEEGLRFTFGVGVNW